VGQETTSINDLGEESYFAEAIITSRVHQITRFIRKAHCIDVVLEQESHNIHISNKANR